MYTVPVEWIEQPHEGYMVNTAFSDKNSQRLEKIIHEIEKAFPGKVYAAPPGSLHITLLDWIAPLVDYDGQPKFELYHQVADSYDKALELAVSAHKEITIHFTELCVSETTVYIRGYDLGEFAAIRQAFVDSVTLLPSTKQPPTIIHASLIRFTDKIPIEDVQKAVSTMTIDLYQTVEWFRLVHSLREPMLEFKEIKRYTL